MAVRAKVGLPTRREFISPVLARRHTVHPTLPDPKSGSSLLRGLCAGLWELCVKSFSSRQVKTSHPPRRASLSILQEGFTPAPRPTASSSHRSLHAPPYP